MTVRSFSWYELRTTDTRAAAAFYGDVLGLELHGSVWLSNGEPVLGLAPLPERAAARGAPAHWLGHVAAGAGEVDALVRRFVALGGEVLGPAQRDAGGSSFTVVRDPLGAVLAVSERAGLPAASIVAWHQLHTTDSARAWSVYEELFGWSAREPRDLGGDFGSRRTFAWGASGPAVGGVADTARSPRTHVHWSFGFAVDDIDAAAARVRARGGDAPAPLALPGGDRVAVCHDPQGAELVLYARA